MKIGIVTFYRVANYGAMLQAYALWKYLAARGHEVVFVQFPFAAPTRLPFLRCLVSRCRGGVRSKLKQYVRYPMTQFAAAYPQTIRCTTPEDFRKVGETCDMFVVGSDQMWNPTWCSGTELSTVMLDFVPEGKKRIAYAVSLGVREWRKDQNRVKAAELMNRFAAISVREQSAVGIVEGMTGRHDVQCLLDPTLLHTADFYRHLFTAPSASASPYIFNYLLDEWSDSAEEASVLRCVQEQLGISFIKTDKTTKLGFLSPLCRLFKATGKVSVPEWLSLVANSQFVITNSFHGTVFAILFHRPFVSLLLRGSSGNMNERALSLLNKMGLSTRAIFADEVDKLHALISQGINWQAIDNAIKLELEKTAIFFEGI